MTVYSLDGMAIYMGGREITAFGEGGAIEIARSNELWENQAMVDGQIVSSRILDESVMITLTVRYDSPANQVLQRFAEARATTKFSCSWPNGDTLDGEEARVQKYPDITDGQSPGDRQWQIYLPRGEYAFSVGA